MKQKNIVFLAYDEVRASFFEGLFHALKEDETKPDVRCFVQHLSGRDLKFVENKQFVNFETADFCALNYLGPIDIIILFNGRSIKTAHSTEILKKRFPDARFLYMEQGWLPQKGNVYLAEKGVGVGCKPLTAYSQSEAQAKFLDLLKTPFYEGVSKLKNPLPEYKYVFFPMQIEADTSIIYDSPVYKRNEQVMEVLRSFCSRHGLKLLFRRHPKDDQNMKIAEKDPHVRRALHQIAEDPMGSYAAMLHAEVVAGINSTLLIESLVFNKMTFALGENMASIYDVYHWHTSYHETFSELLDAESGGKARNKDFAVISLLAYQFSKKEPPLRIVNNIVG